jgi:hypothetical protein
VEKPAGFTFVLGDYADDQAISSRAVIEERFENLQVLNLQFRFR